MVENLQDALRIFVDRYLRGHGRVVEQCNGKKGIVAYRVVATHTGKYYILFLKRDWYHTFSYRYPNTGHKGVGQTVNLGILRDAAQERDIIAVMMSDESVWILESEEWLSYVEEFNTYRTPSTETSEEASVPDNMLRPFGADKTVEQTTRKPTKAQIQAELDYEEYWKNIREWRNLPLLKCPHCTFKNIYKDVIEHHLRYTRVPGHPKS